MPLVAMSMRVAGCDVLACTGWACWVMPLSGWIMCRLWRLICRGAWRGYACSMQGVRLPAVLPAAAAERGAAGGGLVRGGGRAARRVPPLALPRVPAARRPGQLFLWCGRGCRWLACLTVCSCRAGGCLGAGLVQLQGSPAGAGSGIWPPMHSCPCNPRGPPPLHWQASQRTSTASRLASTTICESGAYGGWLLSSGLNPSWPLQSTPKTYSFFLSERGAWAALKARLATSCLDSRPCCCQTCHAVSVYACPHACRCL